MKYKDLILQEFESQNILEARFFVSKFPSWDKSTIYRNLERLAQQGLIKKVENLNNSTVYELNHSHHHLHKLCQNCGKIEEVDDNKQQVFELLNLDETQNSTVTITTDKCQNCPD